MTPAQSRRLGRAVLIATLLLLVAVPFILATWRWWVAMAAIGLLVWLMSMAYVEIH